MQAWYVAALCDKVGGNSLSHTRFNSVKGIVAVGGDYSNVTFIGPEKALFLGPVFVRHVDRKGMRG